MPHKPDEIAYGEITKILQGKKRPPYNNPLPFWEGHYCNIQLKHPFGKIFASASLCDDFSIETPLEVGDYVRMVLMHPNKEWIPRSWTRVTEEEYDAEKTKKEVYAKLGAAPIPEDEGAVWTIGITIIEEEKPPPPQDLQDFAADTVKGNGKEEVTASPMPNFTPDTGLPVPNRISIIQPKKRGLRDLLFPWRW